MALTLDDIRSSISTKYASFQFEDFELRNPLRLPKVDRAKMAKLYEAEESEDQSEDEMLDSTAKRFGSLLELVATPETRVHVRKFLKSIERDDDRLLILTEIMEAYNKDQQVGEA